MAIVSSVGTLQAVNRMAAPAAAVAPTWTNTGGSILGFEGDAHTYAALYRTQPSVRTVVDFLARNIAQLGIHVFRRVADNDRVRLVDHELARWLAHPNPGTTRYRLVESLMTDMGVYFNAYWLKVRQTDRLGLVRIPPEQMQVFGALTPQAYRWTTANGYEWDFAPSEIVHFSGFNPDNALKGLSPLETLRRILAEEIAAREHREGFWRNAARMEGIVERPLAARTWNPDQINSFREQWHGKFGGRAGSGSVVVLQDGMTYRPNSFSPKDSEFTAARKLTYEEVTREYHVQLPMVGILDHATFSNIREQHKNLYQDTLGPWLEMIVQEVQRQLLPECADDRDVYVEFNIAEKLTGSFEEQAASLQTLCGGPVMTRNEGRARLNLPADPDPASDRLVRPLNLSDAPSSEDVDEPTMRRTVRRPAPVEEDEAINIAPVIAATWERQQQRLAKEPDHGARVAAFDVERWNKELARALEPVYLSRGLDAHTARRRANELAYIVNHDTFTLIQAGAAAFGPDREASAYVV